MLITRYDDTYAFFFLLSPIRSKWAYSTSDAALFSKSRVERARSIGYLAPLFASFKTIGGKRKASRVAV